MAKQQRRAHVRKGNNGEHQGHIEETFDDSLLPDATEIARLQELDPNMITWLKERAEKEQDFRHEFTREKLGMIKNTEKGERRVNYLGLICSFLLLGAGMYISYMLIIKGYVLVGSLFSGTTLVAIAALYMRKVKSNNNNK